MNLKIYKNELIDVFDSIFKLKNFSDYLASSAKLFEDNIFFRVFRDLSNVWGFLMAFNGVFVFIKLWIFFLRKFDFEIKLFFFLNENHSN